MLSGPELEKAIYHRIRQKPELYDILNYRYFHTKVLGTCYKLDKKFYNQYHKIPTEEQLKTITKINKITELTDADLLTEIFSVDIAKFDIEWLDKQLDSWIKHRTAELIILDSAMLMKQETNSDNIDEIVENVYDIFRERSGISYKFEAGLNFFKPESHYQEPGNYFSTGYPFLDVATGGGWEKGSLVVIAGAPKAGKTVWATNLAANALRMGYNIAFISLEMKSHKLVKRIGSNLFEITMSSYDQFAENPDNVTDKLDKLRNNNTYLRNMGQLFIKQYPASSAGVPEIENYLRRLEETEHMKLDLVIIDYINIMKNWRNPNTENLYSKIKQIAEDLRAMLTRNDWAGFSLTQLNRCLTLDTIVQEKSKGLIELRNLQKGDYIMSHGGYTRVKHIFNANKQKVLKIVTKSGKTIKCSKNHVFPISSGIYKRADELLLGDNLIVKKDMNCDGDELLLGTGLSEK